MYKGKLEKISTNINPVIDTILHAAEGVVRFYALPKKDSHFVCIVGKEYRLGNEVMTTTSVQDIEHHMTEKSMNFWTKNTEYKLTYEPQSVEA